MKKALYLAAIVLCLVLSLSALTACFGGGGSDETEPPATTDGPETHEHVWDEGTVVKAGSCDKDTKEEVKGEILYTCTVCGETRTEETDGHTWDDGKVIDAADCTHTGMRMYTCTVCKAKKTAVIPTNGMHKFTDGYLVVAPTENSAGQRAGICSICGAVSRVEDEMTYEEYSSKLNAATTAIGAFKTESFGGREHTKMSTDKYSAPGAYPTAGEHPRIFMNKTTVRKVRAALQDPANAATVTSLVEVANGYASGKVTEYSAGVLNCARAKAFLYQMTGVKLYGYDAIRLMKEFLTTCTSIGSSGDPCRKYGEIMFATAVVYDWCYDLLTTTDKTQFISGVEHKVVNDTHMEVGFPPSGQWAITGHGAERQILRDYLSFALAIYDEEPTWYQFIGGRIYQEYVPVRDLYYEAGYYPQGVSIYLSLRFAADLWSAWLLKSATGDMPYDADGMKQVLHTVYSYVVDGANRFFEEGDDEARDGVENMKQFATAALISAYLFDDPTAMSWADFANYSYIEKPYILILKSSGVEGKAATRYDGLDLIVYNGGWLGQVIAHSNWTNTGATVLMKIGNHNNANHDHADSGAFQIYYKGLLAGDSGFYDKYDSNHHLNYHKSTIAHNSIVLQKGSNLIQQRRPPEMKSLEPASYDRAWTNSQYQFGTTTGHAGAYLDEAKTQPKYAYIAGDIAKAYASTVTRLDRRMLAVYDTGNASVPMYFFVYDNITASDSSYQKVFLLHTINEPTISGKTVTVVNGDGKLVLQNVVGNTTLSKVGGAGHNYDVGGSQINTLKGEDDGYWGRAEIKTVAGNENDVMLNVMYVCDKNKTPEGQTATAFSNTLITGSVIGKVAAVFVNAAERRSNALTFTAPGTGDLTYYVSGVKAGKWTVTAGGVSQTVTATEDGGLLVFTAPAGQVSLSPQ